MCIRDRHFGALHPIETALAVILAVAPFMVLFVVILRRRIAKIEPDAPVTPGSNPPGKSEPDAS